MGYESLNLGQSHKTGINETIESEFINQLDDSDRKKLFSEIYKNDYLLLEKFYKADLLTSWNIIGPQVVIYKLKFMS